MEPLVRWWAYEYPIRKRSSDWYVAVGIVAFAAFVASLLLKNFLFAVLIVLGTALVFLYSVRRPTIVTFEITDVGIVLHKKLYPYKELEAFYVTHAGPSAKLLVESKRKLMPLISIPLENVEPTEVHETLLHYLREKEMDEPLTERIMNKVGF